MHHEQVSSHTSAFATTWSSAAIWPIMSWFRNSGSIPVFYGYVVVSVVSTVALSIGGGGVGASVGCAFVEATFLLLVVTDYYYLAGLLVVLITAGAGFGTDTAYGYFLLVYIGYGLGKGYGVVIYCYCDSCSTTASAIYCYYGRSCDCYC